MTDAIIYCKDCYHYSLEGRMCFWHGDRKPYKKICSDYKPHADIS